VKTNIKKKLGANKNNLLKIPSAHPMHLKYPKGRPVKRFWVIQINLK